MLIYRVKYTESESDIKNNDFFYKNTKQSKILSNFWRMFETSKNIKNNSIFYFVLCIICIIYFLYFLMFVNFVSLYILDFYLYTRIRVGLFMSWCRVSICKWPPTNHNKQKCTCLFSSPGLSDLFWAPPHWFSAVRKYAQHGYINVRIIWLAKKATTNQIAWAYLSVSVLGPSFQVFCFKQCPKVSRGF